MNDEECIQEALKDLDSSDPKVCIAAIGLIFEKLRMGELTVEGEYLSEEAALESFKSFLKTYTESSDGLKDLNERMRTLREKFPEKTPTTLVEAVNKYTELKSCGGHYVAVCPFHRERTGSFTVKSDEDSFHCFGCGVNGKSMEEFFGMIKDQGLQKGWA